MRTGRTSAGLGLVLEGHHLLAARLQRHNLQLGRRRWSWLGLLLGSRADQGLGRTQLESVRQAHAHSHAHAHAQAHAHVHVHAAASSSNSNSSHIRGVATRRGQGQIPDSGEIELTDAARHKVLQMVLRDARGASDGRVPLEGRSAMGIGRLQVAPARQRAVLGERVGRAKEHGLVLGRHAATQAYTATQTHAHAQGGIRAGSLSGGLRSDGHGNEGQLLGLGHDVILHAEPSQPQHNLRLNEAEAHGHHGHAHQDVRGGGVQGQGAVRRQLAEANGAQRGEAEVQRLEDAPVLELVEQDGAAAHIAEEDAHADGDGDAGRAAWPLSGLLALLVLVAMVLLLLRLLLGLLRRLLLLLLLVDRRRQSVLMQLLVAIVPLVLPLAVALVRLPAADTAAGAAAAGAGSCAQAYAAAGCTGSAAGAAFNTLAPEQAAHARRQRLAHGGQIEQDDGNPEEGVDEGCYPAPLRAG